MGNDAADNGILLISVGPKVNCLTPYRLSKDSNLFRITSKRSNVIANPFNANSLIAKTKVGRLAWSSREAEDVDSVVNRNNNNILRACKILAVVEWSVAASKIESYLQLALHLISPLWIVNESILTSSKEENQHRLGSICHISCFGPDIQIQAIFALRGGAIDEEISNTLRALWSETRVAGKVYVSLMRTICRIL